jgi:hypothetical protein
MTAPRSLLAAAIVLAAAVVSVRAHSAPASPPQASDKPDFSGTWQLDRGISTDLTSLTFEPRANGDNQRASMGRGGYGGRGGGGGGGFGGFGGRNTSRAPAKTGTPEEQARLKELTDQIRSGSATLVISHHEPTLAISDAQGKTRFLKTDGGTDQNQLASSTIESTTRWEGSRLITDYTLGTSRMLAYTFTLLPATKQLVIRIKLEDSQNPRAAGPEAKLAYTLSSATVEK